MDIVTLFGMLILGFLIGCWANAWGRNPFGWGIFGALIPFFAVIALVIVGKSLTKKAQEATEVERLMATRWRKDTPWHEGGAAGNPDQSWEERHGSH